MAAKRKQLSYPTFGVFAEALPEAVRLADPATPTDERERLLSDVKDTIDIVKEVAKRNTQVGRHRANHARRDQVMADYKYVRDKRGEPKRLAKESGVPLRTVEKWIDQLRQDDTKGPEAIPDDWRTVYVGNRLRQQARVAGKKRRQRKG